MGGGVPQELGTAPEASIHLLGRRVVHQHLLGVVILVPDGHDAVAGRHVAGVAQGAGNHHAGAPDALQGLGVGDPPGAQGCVGGRQREGGVRG